MNKNNNKDIGYFCCHIPMELIIAGDFNPFKLTGLRECPNKSSGYFPTDFCMFAKNTLNEILHLEKNNFAGIIFSNSCDAMERLYDVCQRKGAFPFTYMLDVPRKGDSRGIKYFLSQLNTLKVYLEKYKGEEIPEDKIKQAIEIYNKSGELFNEISNLRVKYNFKASELVKIILDKRDHPEDMNIKLRDIINSGEKYLIQEKNPPRILLSGSIMEDNSLLKFIEDAGGISVYEDFCSLNILSKKPIDNSKDPLKTMAEKYIEDNLCPRKSGGTEKKIVKLKNIIKTHKVDGVIFYLMKFCDIFSWETHLIANKLRSEKIPVMIIEGDYPIKARGQLITRIEAFIEMLGDNQTWN